MATSEVRRIEDAIGKLTPGELDELYSWLDHNHPQPIDERLATDVARGGLDRAIMRALDDEAEGRTQPL